MKRSKYSLKADYLKLLLEDTNLWKRLRKPSGQEPSLWYYFKSATHKDFQIEINRWCRAAYDTNGQQVYKRRLNNLRSDDQILSIMGELRSLWFVKEVLGWKILEHEPYGYKAYRGEFLASPKKNIKVFIEVKSPYDVLNQNFGSFSYLEELKKLIIKEAYKKLPRQLIPTVVIVTPNFPLPYQFDLMQALYGTMGISIPLDSKTGAQIGETQFTVIDKRCVFQPNIFNSLGAVIDIDFKVGIKAAIYSTSCYINPFAHAQSKVKISWFGHHAVFHPKGDRMVWRNKKNRCFYVDGQGEVKWQRSLVKKS